MVLLLGACCQCPDPPLVPPLDCAHGPAFPPVPPSPRTVAAVVAWGNANAIALGKTQAELADCRANLQRLIEMVEEHAHAHRD